MPMPSSSTSRTPARSRRRWRRARSSLPPARARAGLGYIRVNATTTEFGFGDIAAVVQKGVDGIILPKVEAADEIRSADWTIASLEKKRGLPVGRCDLIPIIETAKGHGEHSRDCVRRHARQAHRLRCRRLHPRHEHGVDAGRDRAAALPQRVRAGLQGSRHRGAARHGVGGPQGSRGLPGLGAPRQGARLPGQDVHPPDQVPVANEVFTPSAAEVEWSRKAVAAFEAAEKAGSASIQLEGKFIDYPIVYRARRVLETMERIAAREAASHANEHRGDPRSWPMHSAQPRLPNQPSSRCRASASSTCRASSPARSARRSSPSSAPR